MSRLGKALAILRVSSGLSQEELAKLAEIRTGSISDYECGRITPGLKSLEKLVQGMGYSLAAIESAEGLLRNLESDRMFRIPKSPQAGYPGNGVLASVAVDSSLIHEAEEIAKLGGRFVYRLIRLLFQVLVMNREQVRHPIEKAQDKG